MKLEIKTGKEIKQTGASTILKDKFMKNTEFEKILRKKWVSIESLEKVLWNISKELYPKMTEAMSKGAIMSHYGLSETLKVRDHLLEKLK